jgi:hypothetical protein
MTTTPNTDPKAAAMLTTIDEMTAAVTRVGYYGDLYRQYGTHDRRATLILAARIAHRMGVAPRTLAIEAGVSDAQMGEWLTVATPHRDPEDDSDACVSCGALQDPDLCAWFRTEDGFDYPICHTCDQLSRIAGVVYL